MRPKTMVLCASMATLALTACGPRPADDQPPAEAAIAARLSARDFVVVPAGDTTPNSGHFHLFLDRDVSEAGEPIPAEPGQIIHLGTGADSLTLEVVTPGAHRLIGVVGDAAHVPVQPWIVDTVRFFVR